MLSKGVKVETTEAYKDGYMAFEKGWDIKQCPFLRGSSSYQRWAQGYRDAKDDSEAREKVK